MNHRYDDGGRRAAGYRGKVGDCTTRAIAIATETPYREVLEAQLAAALVTGDPNANAKANCERVLVSLGWEYVKATRKRPAPAGIRTTVNGSEVYKSRRWPTAFEAVPPRGRYVASMHGHYAAVVDGVLRDEWDSRDKPIYGYWQKA